MVDPKLPSPLIKVRLLNGFDLSIHNAQSIVFHSQRLQSLFAYLLLHKESDISRKVLAFLLWPESNEAQALTNLRKHIMHLKDALRNLLPDIEQLIATDRSFIRWNPPPSFQCDVDDFHTLLSGGNGQNGVLDNLRAAIELYKGELLPGCYDEWLLPLREQLEQQYLAALERLSTLLEEQRNYGEAIQRSQQILRVDPLHEATYRRLIRLYALNEDRAAALRTYHTCVTQLREELGIDPDEETQAVYERLLNGVSLTPLQPELAAYAPFVGRQAEWQRLQNRWKLALRGTPQFALIAGEAGIGKTRLAEEMLSWANHQGFCTVRSRCYAAEGRLTYAPIIEWLRSEKLRSQRSKLAIIWQSELARLLPEILNDNPAIPAPEPITQSTQRHRLFEAVTRALLVGEPPLILLVDDLQWCDKETLELLHFLLRNANIFGQSKLMLIGTARLPDEVEPNHPLYELLNPLRSSDSLTQLDLKRLTAVETSQLATQMAEQQLDEHALKQLFADTDGNPLFVVETMRATDSQLAHNGSSDLSVLLSMNATEEILQHLPPKVLAVIQSRLAQLSSTARELCEWAAIIGRAFTLDLLTAASKIDPDKAVNALDELWQRRIIREQGSDAYDFSHDRIRDVAAAGVSRVRRKYLHRCVAEVLEEQGAGQLDSFAVRLAVHYEAARVLEKAIIYYERAAKYAPQIYANYDAVPYLQRAITLLKILPENEERDRRELVLLTALGPALATVGPGSSSLMSNYYIQASTLSQRLNVALHPSFSRIYAIHRVGHHDYMQASSIGQQLLQMAGEQTSNAKKLAYVEGCYVLGIADFLQGHFEQAKYYLQQACDNHTLLQKPYNSVEYAQDIGITSRVRLGWNLWHLGFPDQACKQCDIALEAANQLDHSFTKSVVVGYATTLACTCQSIVIDETAYPYLSNIYSAFDRAKPMSRFYDGWLKILHGETTQGAQQLLTYVSHLLQRDPTSSYFPHQITIACDGFLKTGNFELGLEWLSVALELLNGNQDYWYLAEIRRIKGELLLSQGNCSEAEAHFLQSLDISRRQQAKSLELRAAMSMARLWEQQGKRNEARELLAEIYNWFTEGFDTADLQEAESLLGRLN